MSSVSKKQILSYAFMPQVKKRFGDLFASGFHYVPYFIALVYQIVRLLPANHLYLKPENMGRFGIRNVIAEAANNLIISRNNIDQIILFFAVMAGLVLLFLQLGVLLLSGFIEPVMAATDNQFNPNNIFHYFRTPNPSQDLALIMLDMVFGVQGLFGSCISTQDACLGANTGTIAESWPFPIHYATQRLFNLYSIGLLVVAAFIASYFIITIIAETAQTGTPFGKRFNKVWAPLRIVTAIGLLIPVSQGLNSAQFIVLHAAKYGSGFATNGWNVFNDALNFNALTGQTYAAGNVNASITKMRGENPQDQGANSSLVAVPTEPSLAGLLQMLFTAKVCRELHKAQAKPVYIEPYVVKEVTSGTNLGSMKLTGTYGKDFPNNDNPTFKSYEELIEFADGAKKIKLRFGYKSQADFPKELGYVAPICGEITLILADPREPKPDNIQGSYDADIYAHRGVEIMQRLYFFIVNISWFWVFDGESATNPSGKPNYPRAFVNQHTDYVTEGPQDVSLPEAKFISDTIAKFKRVIRAALVDPNALEDPNDPNSQISWVSSIPGIGEGAVVETLKDPSWDTGSVLRSKGWAGAAIWYNRIAELNGALTAATSNVPLISKYPQAMEKVAAQRQKSQKNVDLDNRFNPQQTGGTKMILSANEETHAVALWHAYRYWGASNYGVPEITGNALKDMLNSLFGTTGLFDMRRNVDVHPLAQLVTIGRSLVQAAINSLTIASGTGAAKALAPSLLNDTASKTVIGMMMTITVITITIGFLLFYIVPFLPFIYFFFALGGWVKGIFEAMVGAPLWALAHIRIDGNGLPGQAAVNGYFLIFEIFLRPILIIFGMLASISIFSALVSVLNDIWDSTTVNVGGFDVEMEKDIEINNENVMEQMTEFFRGPVDTFFYTIVYAVVVYMMAMSSFKLIDLIPNNILRWMGQSVASFNDSREDAAQSLMQTAGVGGQQAIRSIGEGTEGVLKSLGKSQQGK